MENALEFSSDDEQVEMTPEQLRECKQQVLTSLTKGEPEETYRLILDNFFEGNPEVDQMLNSAAYFDKMSVDDIDGVIRELAKYKDDERLNNGQRDDLNDVHNFLVEDKDFSPAYVSLFKVIVEEYKIFHDDYKAATSILLCAMFLEKTEALEDEK